MNRTDFESDFSGDSTDVLTVTATTTYASPDAVPSGIATLLVRQYGKFAETPTLAAVLALTDTGVFTNYQCTVTATQATLNIVATHMGDTFVGIGVHDGQQVAELNDCFLSGVSRG